MGELIRIENKSCSWEEAIKMSANLLIENGYASELLIDKIIQSTLKNGPYYILCPKLALAHAEIGDHIYKTGISLVIFKEPIKFSNEEKHNVNLLFTLVTTSSDDHMDKIMKFAELFSNKNFVDKLILSNDINEIKKMLKGII